MLVGAGGRRQVNNLWFLRGVTTCRWFVLGESALPTLQSMERSSHGTLPSDAALPDA